MVHQQGWVVKIEPDGTIHRRSHDPPKGPG
jgi:hypothetical protein